MTQETLSRTPEKCWPDGMSKTERILQYEQVYGTIFERGGFIWGINPEVEYRTVLDKIRTVFERFLTPIEMRNFDERTQRYEIVSYDGRVLYDAPADGGIASLLMRIQQASTTKTRWLDTDQGVVLILLNKYGMEELLDRDFPDLHKLIIQVMLAHELLHHLLETVDVPKEEQIGMEEEIDKVARGVVAGRRWTSKRIRRFLRKGNE